MITTIAGGVGGPALATRVPLGGTFRGVAVDAAHLYIAAGTAVRKVRETGDWLTTPAGTGVPGPRGDGQPAVQASLKDARGVAVWRRNLVIADTGASLVRVVAASTGTFWGQSMSPGNIYTVAGTGTAGFFGDGGLGTSAQLSAPAGVAVDAAGNIFIADNGNGRIREVSESTGIISTVAGGGTDPSDGALATQAAISPGGVAVYRNNILVSDGDRIREVAAKRGTHYTVPMRPGRIYTVAGGGDDTSDNVPATSAYLHNVGGLAVDHYGNLVLTLWGFIERGTDRVRVVAAGEGTFYQQSMHPGDIYTVAGGGTDTSEGALATSATVYPWGVAVDGAGNLLISTFAVNGSVRMVAETSTSFYGIPMTQGHVYTVAGDTKPPYRGDNGPATSGLLRSPSAVVVDRAANVIIADSGGGEVRAVADSINTSYGKNMTPGNIYAVASPVSSVPSGVAGDNAGNVLFADTARLHLWAVPLQLPSPSWYILAGNGTSGFSGDGGPPAKAQFSNPSGMAVDGFGNVFVADTGNDRIRMIANFTGRLYGQPVTAGNIYTVAHAGLSDPAGVAVERADNVLLIADSGNNRILAVPEVSGHYYGQDMNAGYEYTLVGTGLNDPRGVGVDFHNNVLIADTGNNQVKVFTAATGTFFNVPMDTIGSVYTVAGNGTSGFAGDGGQATSAELASPQGVVMGDFGNLVIADTGNNRIREIGG